MVKTAIMTSKFPKIIKSVIRMRGMRVKTAAVVDIIVESLLSTPSIREVFKTISVSLNGFELSFPKGSNESRVDVKMLRLLEVSFSLGKVVETMDASVVEVGCGAVVVVMDANVVVFKDGSMVVFGGEVVIIDTNVLVVGMAVEVDLATVVVRSEEVVKFHAAINAVQGKAVDVVIASETSSKNSSLLLSPSISKIVNFRNNRPVKHHLQNNARKFVQVI